MRFVLGDVIQDSHGSLFLIVGKNGEMKPIDDSGDAYENYQLVSHNFREDPEFEIEVPEDLLNDTFPEDIKELLLDPAVKRGLIHQAEVERTTKSMLNKMTKSFKGF